jgi:hypothetical protein
MKKLDVMLGLVAVAGLAVACWSRQQLQTERERSADLRRQMSSLQAQLDHRAAVQPEKPAEVVEQPVARQPEDSHPPGTVVAYLSAQEAKELADRRATAQLLQKAAQRERLMMRDPAFRQNRREEMRQRYAPLRADAIRVGMTPQQADRVVDMELDRNLRFTDLGGSAGQTPTPEMIAEMKRVNDAAQTDLRQLLGDELFARWTQYQASGQERSEVSQWRAQLSEPIDDQKAYAIAQSLYVERQRRSSEYEDYVKAAGITDRYTVAPEDRQRWLDLEKEANQRTHDAMAGTLSASQLASLDQMLAARLVPIEAALRLQLEGKLAKQD